VVNLTARANNSSPTIGMTILAADLANIIYFVDRRENWMADANG